MEFRTVAAIGIGLIVVWGILIGLLWLLRPRDARLRDLVQVIPDVVRLVRQLLGDGGVPLRARLALIGLLVYLVNPIDLIPEFIPILGPLDDVVVAVLVLRYVRRTVGLEELRRRWSGTGDGFALLGGILGST